MSIYAHTKYFYLTTSLSIASIFFLNACNSTNSQAQNEESSNKPVHVQPIASKIKNQSSKCYYRQAAPEVRHLPLNQIELQNNRIGGVGAIVIDMDEDHSFTAYYPSDDFQEKLNQITSRKTLITLVENAKLGTQFIKMQGFLPSSYDFYVNNKSTTVFRLEPRTWYFQNTGFRAENIPTSLYSPFSPNPEPSKSKKILLVDFDKNGTTPQGAKEEAGQRTEGCHYKYTLPVVIRSFSDTRETFVDIDPIIGNNGGPPGPP